MTQESQLELETGSSESSPPSHSESSAQSCQTLTLEVVKRWTTDKRAEKGDDVITAELREEACKLMELSGAPGGWKLARTHTNKRGVKFVVYWTIVRYASGNAFAFTSYCSFSNYISGCSNPRR